MPYNGCGVLTAPHLLRCRGLERRVLEPMFPGRGWLSRPCVWFRVGVPCHTSFPVADFFFFSSKVLLNIWIGNKGMRYKIKRSRNGIYNEKEIPPA